MHGLNEEQPELYQRYIDRCIYAAFDVADGGTDLSDDEAGALIESLGWDKS